ncbi:MAG: pyridoxamine 5'-phosphate oxidase family protein [Acidimicrobiia bacterium]|jgi:uncharacterized protein
MEVDATGCEVLSRDECLRLLSGERLGRLGLHAGALPVILPVAYAIVDDGVVVRTHEGALIYGAARDSVVAFEVDRPAAGGQCGWSVHVTSVAEEVTDPSQLARLRALPLRRWADGEADRFVRIPLHLISGRRVVLASP